MHYQIPRYGWLLAEYIINAHFYCSAFRIHHGTSERPCMSCCVTRTSRLKSVSSWPCWICWRTSPSIRPTATRCGSERTNYTSILLHYFLYSVLWYYFYFTHFTNCIFLNASFPPHFVFLHSLPQMFEVPRNSSSHSGVAHCPWAPEHAPVFRHSRAGHGRSCVYPARFRSAFFV